MRFMNASLVVAAIAAAAWMTPAHAQGQSAAGPAAGEGAQHNAAPAVRPGTLGFTKLIVDDIDAMSKFYRAVCQIEEEGREDARIGGHPIREVHFRSDPPGTGNFTLTKFLDAPRRAGRAVILGFITKDLAGFVQRAVRAGGTAVDPVQTMPEYGLKVAFVRDIEGNLIEVVQML